MDNLKDIRWRQRFQNLSKAYLQLQKGVNLKEPNDIEIQGIIQTFEFTFELSWKTLKDYLESQGVTCSFPRDVLKQAFYHEILENGELWLEMLSNRNLLANTYDEKLALESYTLITRSYFQEISSLINYFTLKVNEEQPTRIV